MLRFRVRKEFTWGGTTYHPGDIFEIVERHPRIEGMLLGHYLIYDPTPDSVAKNDLAAQEAQRKIVEAFQKEAATA